MNSDFVRRLTLALSGLIGAAGVALSAMAAHGADPRLIGTAAAISLAHAPALLALHAAFERIRTAVPAALLIGLGSMLFAGDLLFRSAYGQGLFPMSAPTGGLMMIAGWLALVLGAFWPKR